MLKATNGIVFKRKKGGKDWWYLRLYLVDTDAVERKDRYKDKYIPTTLLATKKNQAEANALLYEEIQKYSEVGSSTRFGEYCEHWLSKMRPELETTTYEGYAYKVGHIIDYFGQHPVTLSELSVQNVDDFYTSLYTRKKSCSSQRKKVGLSKRTIRDIGVLLRTILSEAVTKGFIKSNPASLIPLPKCSKTGNRSTHISAEQVGTFLDAIKGHRLEAVFLLTLFYGLRREEVLGLKWSAIRNDRLHIEHTVARVKTTVAKDGTKTDKSTRCYLIPEQIRLLLDAIKASQENNQRLYGKAYHKSNYVFTWEDGRPYTPDYVTKSFKKLVLKDDRLDSDLHLHDLRASCVSILIHSGRDVKEVQKYVGHSDAQTTLNIYARTNEKQQEQVVNTMAEILFA